MKNSLKYLTTLTATCAASSTAMATNGDNLIAVGPKARAMGGVGIAAPQDAISAVFANPAAMCVTPGCNSPEANFAGTLFMPDVSASTTLTGIGRFKADSEENIFAIPAFGLSMPIDPVTRRWRFGLAAYGVSGLGVDYRDTVLDQNIPGTAFPIVAGEYTQLQIMKFAPSISYQVTPNFSVGGAVHIDYATLDLRNGSTPAYGFGVQLGVLYQVTEKLTIGGTYVSPQETEFDNVIGPTGFNPRSADLTLESPHQFGVGVAYSFLDDRLIAEVDGKWYNWGGADGYEDFDWSDQWIVGLGVQYAAIPNKLFLRAGYNYGNNPVDRNNGWGSGTQNVQGSAFPDYYYESFRIIGFPAVVEHHASIGFGYAFSETFELNAAYVHAFAKDVTERGNLVTPGGAIPARLKSELSEDSLELGMTWRF